MKRCGEYAKLADLWLLDSKDELVLWLMIGSASARVSPSSPSAAEE